MYNPSILSKQIIQRNSEIIIDKLIYKMRISFQAVVASFFSASTAAASLVSGVVSVVTVSVGVTSAAFTSVCSIQTIV